MARSRYIYIVFDNQPTIRNVFTVKHECKSWLDKPGSPEDGIVQRWVDGGFYPYGELQESIRIVDFKDG